MRTPLAIVSAAVVASTASLAHAQVHDSDIVLTVEDGTITTNAVIDDVVVPDRVFTGTFGDSGFPGFTSNPGFDCAPGTFQVGTRLGFNLLGPWRRWDPDSETFVATDENGGAGERLEFSFLTLSTVSGDGPVPGFDLAVQPNGGWHRHLDHFALVGDGPLTPGAYAIEFEIYSTDPAVGTSASVWLVHDLDAPSGHVEAAVEHLNAALEPPACTGDLDGTGDVGFSDLLVLLADWGAAGGAADLDEDGTVGFPDLLVMLASWGPCP